MKSTIPSDLLKIKKRFEAWRKTRANTQKSGSPSESRSSFASNDRTAPVSTISSNSLTKRLSEFLGPRARIFRNMDAPACSSAAL